MKFNKFLAIALAISALAFSACTKDKKTDDPTPANPSANLVGKDWRVTSLLLVSPGGTIDMYLAMDPCEKDDLIEFLAAGTVTNKAGATKCDPSDPNTEPGGSWALLNNGAQIRLIDGDTTIADVKELSATTFKLEMTENDMGIVYTTKITFTKN
ncbi:MAG: lipocalin family protein [bacterium]|nr:lipocalin family protein [bacterium]